jgi:group I intron endonuclease
MISDDQIKSGIYKIINIKTNKFYIGSAKSFDTRWKKHKFDLIANKHHSIHLQNAWNKYGSENFIFEIVEIVDDINNLIIREQYYMDLYKSFNIDIGYNISPTAGSRLGCKDGKCSEETKKKISDKLSGKNNPNYGKTTSNEIKEKMRIAQTGKKHSPEHIHNFILANIGRKNTNETKMRISKKNKGKIRSHESKINSSLIKLFGEINESNLKLMGENIVKIREKYATGDYLYKQLSKEYNVSISTISRIINNITW